MFQWNKNILDLIKKVICVWIFFLIATAQLNYFLSKLELDQAISISIKLYYVVRLGPLSYFETLSNHISLTENCDKHWYRLAIQVLCTTSETTEWRHHLYTVGFDSESHFATVDHLWLSLQWQLLGTEQINRFFSWSAFLQQSMIAAAGFVATLMYLDYQIPNYLARWSNCLFWPCTVHEVH